MRRHRSSIASDSLDLLLDTITNTFGGILLLAILLVLLVRDVSEDQTSSARESSSTQAARKALQDQIQQLKEQQEILNQSLAAQALFESGDDDNARQEIMKQLSSLLQAIAEMRAESVANESLSDQLTKQIADQADKLAHLSDDLSRVRKEVQTVEAELQKEQALRTRTMDLPREEVTHKRMTAAIIKKNRLYLVEGNAAGIVFQYNAEHFEVTSESTADVILADGTCLKAKESAGIELNAERLAASLSRIDASDRFLAIVVDPESFASFGEARGACVKLGLEYKLVPVTNFPVREGHTSERQRAQ